MKKILTIVMVLALLGGCSTPKTEQATNEAKEEKMTEVTADGALPTVTIELETGEKMVFELYPKIAPNSVNNFIFLVLEGYYDGVIFHRVIPGFMIQGGDPDGIGTGGPGYSIPGEFNENGFENNLRHTRGVLSMARSMDPDSAGSQFFIMHETAPSLDNKYAAFGQITDGIEHVDTIANVERNGSDKPLVDVVLKSVTVELNGYEPADVIKK